MLKRGLYRLPLIFYVAFFAITTFGLVVFNRAIGADNKDVAATIANSTVPDPAAKIRSLYPDLLENNRSDRRELSSIRELASAFDRQNRLRSLFFVQFSIPGALVVHGTGEALVFTTPDAMLPEFRRSAHTLPSTDEKEFEFVDNQWFRFGKSGGFVSLVDDTSLSRFAARGQETLLHEMCVNTCKDRLALYLSKGKESFLERTNIRQSAERRSLDLPNRISSAAIYHSIVEDFRDSGFKYCSAWEGTIIARVVPSVPSEPPLFIEFGLSGEFEGIDENEVTAFIWQVRDKGPVDRPLHAWQWNQSVKDSP